MKWMLLIFSHLLAGVVGVGLGMYLLPIITQGNPPKLADITSIATQAIYTGTFDRSRQDSDFLHWGLGIMAVTKDHIVFDGKLSPGPDYQLYLSPEFIETESDFIKNKHNLVKIGQIKTFERFILDIPDGVDAAQFNTAIVWCESFGQFISSASYQ